MMFFPSLSSAFKASMRPYRTSRPLNPWRQSRESRWFPVEDQHSSCKRQTWRGRVQRAVHGIRVTVFGGSWPEGAWHWGASLGRLSGPRLGRDEQPSVQNVSMTSGGFLWPGLWWYWVEAAKEIVALWFCGAARMLRCNMKSAVLVSWKMSLIMMIFECNYSKSQFSFHNIVIVYMGPEA